MLLKVLEVSFIGFFLLMGKIFHTGLDQIHDESLSVLGNGNLPRDKMRMKVVIGVITSIQKDRYVQGIMNQIFGMKMKNRTMSAIMPIVPARLNTVRQ